MNGKKAKKIRREFQRKVAAMPVGSENLRFSDGQIVVKKRWMYQKIKAQMQK